MRSASHVLPGRTASRATWGDLRVDHSTTSPRPSSSLTTTPIGHRPLLGSRYEARREHVNQRDRSVQSGFGFGNAD